MSTLILQQKQDSSFLMQRMYSVAGSIQLWLDRHHQRSQLARLDSQQLADIGLDEQQVKLEINRPFWK